MTIYSHILLIGLLMTSYIAEPQPQNAPTAAGSVYRIGDACAGPADCVQINNAICDSTLSICSCSATHPIPNTDSCLTASSVNSACTVSAQCRPEITNAECTSKTCTCRALHYVHTYADGLSTCIPTNEEKNKIPVDPVMIGILASLVLMFIIICAVLRLFSKARFRQDRTILNSANPRLMNTSLFKGPVVKKRDRRRSQAPSMVSGVGIEEAAVASANEGQHEARSTTAEVTVERHPIPADNTIPVHLP